jgi:hypothetical protein
MDEHSRLSQTGADGWQEKITIWATERVALFFVESIFMIVT